MKKIKLLFFISCLFLCFDSFGMIIRDVGGVQDLFSKLSTLQRQKIREIINSLLTSFEGKKFVEDVEDSEDETSVDADDPLKLQHHLTDLKLSPYPGILNAEHVMLVPLLPENWEAFSKAKEFYSGKKIRKKLNISRDELVEVFLTALQEAHLSKFQVCWSLHTRKGLCGFIHVFCTEATKTCDNYMCVSFFNIAPADDDEDLWALSCAFCEGQKIALVYIKSNLESADRGQLIRKSCQDEKNYLRYLKNISDFLR